MTVALRVYVRRGARDWVEVTEGAQVVTAPLQGGEAQIVARSDVPTGTYTEARARFSRVVADVEGGLIVDGEPVTGRVTVIESGIEDPLNLSRPLELEVEEGSLVSIEGELRSGLWIRQYGSRHATGAASRAGGSPASSEGRRDPPLTARPPERRPAAVGQVAIRRLSLLASHHLSRGFPSCGPERPRATLVRSYGSDRTVPTPKLDLA